MTVSSKGTCRIDFVSIGKQVDVPPGATLLEGAQQGGLIMVSACGGLGKCGQCRVTVLKGRVSALTESESAILSQTSIDAGERLACVTRVQEDIKVDISSDALISGPRLQLGGDAPYMKPAPLVTAHQIQMQAPTLQDSRSDLLRVKEALTDVAGQSPSSADLAVIRQLSPLARENQWHLTAYLRNNELVGLAPPESSPLGVAIDLGTTKIAASLLDLSGGKELAVSGALNPQIAYGEDLISRLSHARQNPENGQTLAMLVRETIDRLIGDLITRTKTDRDRIADLCIVGNTAMTHLLLGLPVAQLTVSPYVAATSDAMDIRARDLNLTVAPGANVHFLPGIGGFVGADHVAMILASRLHRGDRLAVGIDIGTNTEIVLFHPEHRMLTAASCASGPAFEGGHIRNGMRAASGAIMSVKFTEKGLSLSTIDHADPVGICGSGIIDALAELHRWKVINPSGRLDKDNPRVRTRDKGPEILLAAADQSGRGREIVLTQNDINEVQLAKGAIKAGLETLLAATGTSIEAVREVVVAGAFGSLLDLKSVLAIGMFPHFPNASYRQVGNAAIEGAKMALISKNARRDAWNIAVHSTHLELSTYPEFNRLYALAMQFPNLDKNAATVWK